jgi:TRAP-type C4-dicarboxylate transport system permease large subunit
MSGWLRYFTLSAQARTGFSSQVAVWAAIAILASVVAAVFLLVAAFIWLSDRYDPLLAGLILGGVFVAVALIAAVIAIIARQRNIERAHRELAAQRAAALGLLDPRMLSVGIQIGQAIGWRRLASLAAVAVIAGTLAGEWFGREGRKEDDREQAEGGAE